MLKVLGRMLLTRSIRNESLIKNENIFDIFFKSGKNGFMPDVVKKKKRHFSRMIWI